MEQLEARLETSASKIGLRIPFIACATGKLPRTVVDGDPSFTAGTNGAWFKFGREWVEANVQDDEELFGLDLHERMHVVLMHMWRRDGRQPDVWNIANDAIINKMIKDMGYKLPAGGVHIDWVTADMDSETVYNKLMQEQPPEDGDGDGEGESGEGEGEGGSGDGTGNGKLSRGKPTKAGKKFGKGGWDRQGDLEDAQDDAGKADMEATIRAAAQMARDCGDKSALVDFILGNPPKASVNWKDEVRAALTSSARDDFTYRRFSRRFLSRKMYLPALQSDAMGGLMIGFDTSGSMSGDDCKQVAGEIQGIVDDLAPDWIKVVYCDAQIGRVQHFNKGEPLELKPTGGGGTEFFPVFDYAQKVEADGEKVAALIYLTDMCGNMSCLTEPDFPVVWGCVYATPQAAPFGSVVSVIV